MSSIWTMRRSANDAKLAGVCGGVAHHWNVDPVLVRVGWALLALSGGVGVVLYAAAWLFIPIEGSDQTVAQDIFGEQSRRWPKELVVAVVLVACVVAFAILSSVSPFGFGPAVILALLWYFGYYKNRPQRPTSPPTQPPTQSTLAPPTPEQSFRYPGPATPFTQAAEAWQQRIAENLAATQQSRTTSPPVPPAAFPTRRDAGEPAEDRSEPSGLANPISSVPSAALSRPAVAAPVPDRVAYFAHPDPAGIYADPPPVVATPVPVPAKRLASRASRRIRAVGLLAALLVIAGLAIAETLGVTVPLAAYLAAPLGVIGLTLIASMSVGRARGLLPLGIALLLALGVVTGLQRIGPPENWSTNSRAYTAISQLPPEGDRIDAGTLMVDLSKLDQTGNATYRAHADLGSVLITVPSDVNVVVNYAIDAGSFSALGESVQGGTEVRGTWVAPKLNGRPTLTLELTADLGEIEVLR